jgi:rod shape-determining protein MreD
MKKAIIYISLIITFTLIYLLQTSFFTNFTIAGVMPNLIIILMLFIGLYMGRSVGIIYGILFGILIDIWIGRNIGITSIGLALVGFLGGIFDKNFSKDSRITIILMVALTTIIYEVIICILKYITIGINLEAIQTLKILMIEVIYNILLTIILYPLMKNAGYEIESEIKGNRIFTRYF